MRTRLRLLGLFILSLLAVRTVQAQQYQWTNFAGLPGGPGNVDATGIASRFNRPNGAAVDASGNVYVADSTNHTIRKITPSGAVSTFAGSPGIAGSTDGTGSAARFNSPYSLAVDSSGNVFVADTANNTIRTITAGGVVSTLAGSAGFSGSTDGTGGGARFNTPYGIAVDSSGTAYVTDTTNSTIRKITSAGVVTTLAGSAGANGTSDGTGSAARFFYPVGLGVDSGGNVYVADDRNCAVRKITAAGVVTTLAGDLGIQGTADGTGSVAKFRFPKGLALDSAANIYVADNGNHTIRKVTPAGVVSTLAGSAGLSGSTDGTGSAARFFSPSGVAADSGGSVYVADTSNNTIRKISPAAAVSTFAGSAPNIGITDGTGSAARFNHPQGVAVDPSGNTYVADESSHTVRKISTAGVVSTLAGNAGQSGNGDGTGNAVRFNFPQAVAVDSAGNVYVADKNNCTIRKITPAGVVSTLAGSAFVPGSADGTGSAARFSFPQGVAVDSAGIVYVADSGNHAIRKITAGGVVSTFAGSAGSSGSTDGTGSAARFLSPQGVAVDSVGAVYVADTGNNTIRKITPAGAVTTLAGSAGSIGSSDGTGNAARFNVPKGLALEGGGNLFVTDTNNHTIRMVKPNGDVTTIGGTAGVSGGASGAGSAALFAFPVGIAVSGTGMLLIGDGSNNRIAQGMPPDTVTLTPVLTTPANIAVTKTPVNVSFTLPEAAANGTVTLTFAGGVSRILTLANTQGTAGTHGFSFNPTDPMAAAEVVAIGGGATVPDGNYAVTLSYQDALGNPPATASSANVLIDTTAPTLNLPGPITFEATSPAGAVVTYAASAGDAGSGIGTASFVPGSGTTFSIGMTTVNASATDNVGNTMTGSFTVTVNPSTPIRYWRYAYFETLVNAGNAANTADPFNKGIPNLATFAFAGPSQSPATASISQFPQVQMSGGNLFYSFEQPAGVGVVTYGAEWRPSLDVGSWTRIDDTGTSPNHIFSVPTAGYETMFIRLNVSSQ
ncbi:MAG: HYR domain-containing protein [Chthoniobacteraceae bacterium]